jgi:C-terminal processing protease CtpA/Prc
MAICSLWGLVKYSHPFVAYRAEIDWDKALLETLSSMLDRQSSGSDISESDFAQIVSSLLSHLHDPNTRLAPNGDEMLHEISPASDDMPGRQQPFVELTKDKVAIVVTTDYAQFSSTDADTKLDQLVNSFASAANSGCAIIFDARSASGDSVKGAQQLGFLFSEAFKCFLSEDLPLPTMRQRMFTGLPEQRRTFSSAFQHGFYVHDAEILHRSAEPQISLSQPAHALSSQGHVGQKPLCFLVSRQTPQPILDIAVAMRSRGLAVFVYQAEESDYRVRKSTGPSPATEYLVYEPYVSASIFHLPGTDGLRVLVRQNERVSPDGTVGFHPDSVVIPGGRSSSQTAPPSSPGSAKAGVVSPPATSAAPAFESDAAIRIGVEFCTGRRPVPRQRLVYPNFSVRRVEDEFKAVGPYPTPELRLLSLFRLWNAVQYFFPYKHMMDNHWDDVLLSNIDQFLRAQSALEFHVAVAQVVKELADTHAFVRSSTLSAHIGIAIPAVRLTTLASGVAAVSQVSQAIKGYADIRPGDIVEAIDGGSVSDRRAFLSKLFAASTPQASLWRSDMKLLAGDLNSKVKIGLRRFADGEQSSLTVELERSLQAPMSASNETLKPYQLLPHVDKSGNPIGWVDLTRLSFAESDPALQSVASCSSIIFDLRGYTKGTIYRIGPMLASTSTQVAIYETPAMMPTLLSDDLQPPSLRSVQTCVVPRPDSPISQTCKIVALINEDTLSHGEYAASFLKAVRPDLTFVGSVTNGALGNITNLVLPGGIQVGFSGMGMTAADGSALQRRGISPDVPVHPTVESLAAGRDPILEKAIEFLQ